MDNKFTINPDELDLSDSNVEEKPYQATQSDDVSYINSTYIDEQRVGESARLSNLNMYETDESAETESLSSEHEHTSEETSQSHVEDILSESRQNEDIHTFYQEDSRKAYPEDNASGNKNEFNYSWLQNEERTKENQGGKQGRAYNLNEPQYGKERPKKKKKSKWPQTIAMGLVFGLIAGSVMFGVNYAGNRLFPQKEQKVYQKIDTTKTIEDAPKMQIPTEAPATEKAADNSSTPSYAGNVAKVAANAMPSLVTISTMSVQEMQSFFGMTESYEVEGAGTGVIVGQNDTELLVATNNHVIDGANEVTVGFVDEQVVSAFVKGADKNNDLAVVGVKLEEIPEETMEQIKVITLGDSDSLVLGEQVVAIGNALGYGQSVTSGYISAFDRELELSDGYDTFTSSGLIQTDAAINSGNSGGALLNMKGELVGINEAKSSSSGYYEASVDNVGYSIPIAKAEPILEELMNLATKDKVEESDRGYLGIMCADVNSETSERYNIPVGVYVRELSSDSPAAEAGMVAGDVITKFDGKTISSYEDLSSALEYCKAGETIDVVISHQDSGKYEEKTISVTLGKSTTLENFEMEDADNSPGMKDGRLMHPQQFGN